MIGGVALAVLVLGELNARSGRRGDLHVYYAAGQRLAQGLDLYQTREGPDPERVTAYIYPPTFALAWIPLGAWPYGLVRRVWFWAMGLVAIRLVVAGLALIRWERQADSARGPPRLATLALVIAALGVARFTMNDLRQGQVNVLVAWLAVEGVLAELRGRRWLGATLVGGACALKLTPGILLLGALCARQWGSAVRGGLAFLGWLALPALVWGPTRQLDYLVRFVTVVTPWNRDSYSYVANNVSLWAWLHRTWLEAAPAEQVPLEASQAQLLAADRLALAASLTVLALGTLWCLLARSAREPARRTAVLLALVPLISPVAWKAHLVILAPALLLAAEEGLLGRETVWPRRAALLLGLLLLVPGRLVLGRELAEVLVRSGGVTLGCALLAGGLLGGSRTLPAPPLATGGASDGDGDGDGAGAGQAVDPVDRTDGPVPTPHPPPELPPGPGAERA